MRWERLDCLIEDRNGNVVDDMCTLLDALPRMRALGPGHRVVRRDGVVLAHMTRAKSELALIRLVNNAAQAA